MPFSSHSTGSSGSIGHVLGSATAVALGSQILPRTGVGSWVYFLVLISMAVAAIVLLSFVVTRIARKLF